MLCKCQLLLCILEQGTCLILSFPTCEIETVKTTSQAVLRIERDNVGKGLGVWRELSKIYLPYRGPNSMLKTHANQLPEELTHLPMGTPI